MSHKKLVYLLAVGIILFILFQVLASGLDKNMTAYISLPDDCLYMTGDANTNGAVNIIDIMFLVNHVFKGGPQPNPPCQGDCNNTNTINVTDIVILVNYVFKGGPKPAKDVDGECCK